MNEQAPKPSELLPPTPQEQLDAMAQRRAENAGKPIWERKGKTEHEYSVSKHSQAKKIGRKLIARVSRMDDTIRARGLHDTDENGVWMIAPNKDSIDIVDNRGDETIDTRINLNDSRSNAAITKGVTKNVAGFKRSSDGDLSVQAGEKAVDIALSDGHQLGIRGGIRSRDAQNRFSGEQLDIGTTVSATADILRGAKQDVMNQEAVVQQAVASQNLQRQEQAQQEALDIARMR